MPRRPRRVAEEAPDPKTFTPSVTVDVTDDTAVYYVNYIEFSSTTNEFALNAARLPAKLSPEKLREMMETGQMRVDATAQLLIPIPLVKAVLVALATHIETFEQAHGEIRMFDKQGGDTHGTH